MARWGALGVYFGACGDGVFWGYIAFSFIFPRGDHAFRYGGCDRRVLGPWCESVDCLGFRGTLVAGLRRSLPGRLLEAGHSNTCSYSAVISYGVHGCRKLLIMPIPRLSSSGRILLDSLSIAIVRRNTRFGLNLRGCRNGGFDPLNRGCVHRFSYSGIPAALCHINNIVLGGRIIFRRCRSQVLVHCALISNRSTAALHFHPFLTFHDIHRFARRGTATSHSCSNISGKVGAYVCTNCPSLCVRFSGGGRFGFYPS